MIEDLQRQITFLTRRIASLEAVEQSTHQGVFTDNVSNPPTDAELDSAIGTPSTVGAGYLALLDDNGAGTNVYLVASDGTNWWHVAMTKAV